MSLLTNLPEALLSSTLSIWLTIVDVAYIDSACCCHALRKDFKKAAYRSHAVLQYPTTMTRRDVDCEELMRWIEYRGAAVTGFFTTKLFLLGHDSREEYLKKHGHAIRWIEFAHEFRFDKDYSEHRQVAMDIAEYCPHLTCLRAADCLEEAGLVKIVQQCPLLEELTVTGGSCTDAFVLELSKHCRALKCVGMMCPRLNEECMLALFYTNPGLISVCLSANGIKESVLKELTLTCPGLTKLSLEGAELTLAALCFVLSKCASLDFVYLKFCRFSGSDFTTTDSAAASASMRDLALSCITITYDELCCLLRVCPGLTRLSLAQCADLMDLEEMRIGTYCPSLDTLIIRDNPATAGGDEMLLDISAHCPRLRVLEIPGSFFESDNALVTLTRLCPLLEKLDLDDSVGVTDGCLFALAQTSIHLKVLKLSSCEKITDLGVAAVTQACLHLTELFVYKCKRVSEEMKKKVEEIYSGSECRAR